MAEQQAEVGQMPFAILTDEATDRDEFDRTFFVENLADVLLEAATPLVVAVYGSWGSGKTSMMLQLRHLFDIADNGRPRAATVWFDPWELSGEDDEPAIALLHAVLNDLGLARDRRIRRALLAVARVVSNDARIPYLGLTMGRVRRLNEHPAVEEFDRRSERSRLRQRFTEVIKRAQSRFPGVPLVVFIDDLDRCKPPVAVAVLEALKLYLNLPGCIFVLGVDRQQLENAVASEYAELNISKESFLDKIVQLPYTVPPLRSDSMLAYLQRVLPPDLSSCSEMLAAAAPDNPRQLKRMVNSLFVHDRLGQLAHFPEEQEYRSQIMCAVILVQNIAPEMYQVLRQSPGQAQSLFQHRRDEEPPEWMSRSLSGSDARLGLAEALNHVNLQNSPPVDIAPYLTLSEQVGEPILEDQKNVGLRAETYDDTYGDDDDVHLPPLLRIDDGSRGEPRAKGRRIPPRPRRPRLDNNS